MSGLRRAMLLVALAGCGGAARPLAPKPTPGAKPGPTAQPSGAAHPELRIAGDEWDQALADPGLKTTQADGLQLSVVPVDGALWRLGLRDGDVIEGFNLYVALGDDDIDLRTLGALHGESLLSIRRGTQHFDLTFVIEPR